MLRCASLRLSLLLLAVAALAVLLLATSVEGRSGRMQWPRFVYCISRRAGPLLATPSGRCASRKMRGQFSAMNKANCMNCDKYFHCMANWLAIHKCRGRFKRKVATVISNCREYSQREKPADRRGDEAANRYGQSGGNCGARYLRKHKCAYNPKTRQCKW
uniref:Serum amyloid A protein n=1 Tax=Rhipicephalus zambeziensis TaxID=60191 RepID=A0A224Z8G1_9ACAR